MNLFQLTDFLNSVQSLKLLLVFIFVQYNIGGQSDLYNLLVLGGTKNLCTFYDLFRMQLLQQLEEAPPPTQYLV